MAFCSNCGKELKESYKFCPKCGKEIENISEVKDDLYEEVFKYVVENEKVSTSMIQNKFNISYNKATNMINMLEEKGFYAWSKLPNGDISWSDYGLKPLWNIINEYNASPKGNSSEKDGVITYYDIEFGGWRSFKIENFIGFNNICAA